jgi:threonine dehydratase
MISPPSVPTFDSVKQAFERIKDDVKQTPIVESST